MKKESTVLRLSAKKPEKISLAITSHALIADEM